MLHIILTVTYLVLTGNAASPDEGSLSDLSTPQDACVVPLEGDTAVYNWKQGGCLLGWSQYFNATYNATAADVSETDLDVDFNTCEAGEQGLGVCPLESRWDDHGPLAVKSPKHCYVNKVWFQVTSTGTTTEEVLSAEWTGVKLVDSRDYTIVIRSWTHPILTPFDEVYASVVWDGIPTNKCYRLLVQVGTTGHVEVKDVNFRMYDPAKMLVDVDVKFAKEDPQRGLHIRTKHGDCNGSGQNVHCRCLDSPEHTENEGKVHMWTCYREYPNQQSSYNQQWTYDRATGQIKNIHGRCLDANNGGEVWMWECDTDNKNQQWDYDWTTGQIKANIGLCLNAPNKGNLPEGGLVHMWECDTSNEDQQWIMYQGSDWEPTWEYVGHMTCPDAWIVIGTAATLEDAKNLMLANDDCFWEGSVLYYSEYSDAASWSVRCVPAPALDPNKEYNDCVYNENWQGYKLHYGHQTQSEWDDVEGDLLISSDSTGGFDSNNDLQLTSVFTVGTSYILDSSLAPTVVTDIYLKPTDVDTVDCPYGYETKAVIGQVGGAGATNRDKMKGSNLMALCVKKQPCAMNVQYVSRVEAIATSETNLDAFTLPDNCQMIGTWDPDWAKSYTSGEVGQYTTGLFQCKSSCTSEMCARVKITAMKPTGIPEINKKANVVGDGATQTADACGARSTDEPLDVTLTLMSGEEITNTNSYTLDKSLGHTFSGTFSTSVDVSAEAGFSVWGATVKGKADFGLSTSMTSGFSSTTNSGRSTLQSTSKTAIVQETAEVWANPGEQVKVVSTSSSLNYNIQFKAMAQCINENGEVLETKPISGKFSGRAHQISGATGTYASEEFCEGSSKWNCVCCKQTTTGQCIHDTQRRRLVDRLFGH